jgi:D-alanyl-D-alanine dipeptidase
MVWDGYRPIAVQKRLWDQYRGTLRIEHPEYTEEELDFRTSFFVSKPSNDPDHPSLHNTGGAVDLTLCDADGNCLYMGSAFDDFSGRAWTNHFEPGYEGHETNLAACRNRRILYHAMTRAGFTNLPSEWWHYDYGDKFWSAFKGKPAMYRGILCAPLPGAFPLH